jgi:hypothetical protein
VKNGRFTFINDTVACAFGVRKLRCNLPQCFFALLFETFVGATREPS